MSKNSKSDVAQLQAALGYLKNEGAPYWSGSIDGVWTEGLATSLRQFQNDNGLPPTGYLSPKNEDKSRQKIIQFAAGTPYANMRGLWGSANVFSLVDVPTIYVQKQIEGLGL